MSNIILETVNLSHVYSKGTTSQVDAIRDVCLKIEKGELVGIIGHTGSGKSTLIQHFNGLLKGSSGVVMLDGKDIWEDKKNIRDVRFKVGICFQYPEYQLFEETVFKDIAFGPHNMKLPKDEIERRVRFAADLFGLAPELLEKSPFELSGGQKRRAAIAGVIAMEPEILILDEPAAGLDPAGRDEILSKVRDMHKRLGITVVLVSHSMEGIAGIADRIVVMNQGSVAMVDKPSEIFKSASELKKIGLAVPQIAEVCMRLREAGVPVSEGIYTVDAALSEICKIIKTK